MQVETGPMVPLPPAARRVLARAPDAPAWGFAALLAVLAVVKLSKGFELLLSRESGAVDLHLRFDETRAWFDGFWIRGAVYPPASQTLLWPAVGWLPFEAARGLWALLTLGCLAWLSWLCTRECGLRSTGARLACALMPLAASATSSAVGIGQIVPLFLPLVATAVLWMARGPSRWADSTGAAILFTIASVKPTLFAPFAWLVLLLPRSYRPALLSGGLYAILTLVALAALRPGSSGATGLDDHVAGGTRWATKANAEGFTGGYGNLQNMSQDAGLAGLENFVLPIASALACGAWLLVHRRTDPWILMGVCALAARLGWYHRVYDDMLLVLPAIALVRVFASCGRPGGADERTARIAAILLAATVAHLLFPGSATAFFLDLPHAVAPFVWLCDLLFLAKVAPVFEGARAEAVEGLWTRGES